MRPTVGITIGIHHITVSGPSHPSGLLSMSMGLSIMSNLDDRQVVECEMNIVEAEALFGALMGALTLLRGSVDNDFKVGTAQQVADYLPG